MTVMSNGFVDKANITVKAGNGGNGCVSFHREKYVAAGGPDGGDGGRGGDVILVVDGHMSTLMDFRLKRKYAAGTGQDGQGKRCSGKDGASLTIRVPRGTLVRDRETGGIIKDMSDDAPFVLARGGRGGWGNQHFATPTRQTPRFAKPGLPGEARELTLELKLLADVGLLGFPNVGKSSLITSVSQAKPIVADYHFTTITPVLGVVSLGLGSSFVMADIPGLIEGASEGIGLGHAFLRHVERCRMLVHVLDAAGSEGRDPIEDFELLNKELASYMPDLVDSPQIVASNKIDLASEEQLRRLRDYFAEKGYEYFEICAPVHEGTDALAKAVFHKLQELPPIRRYEPEALPEEFFDPKEGESFQLHKEDEIFFVEGPWLLRALRGCNMDDYESLQYFQRALQRGGVIDALEAAGVQEGDTVSIYDFEFEYVR